MISWMQSLREGGFTDKEMDEILSHLNKTYAKAKGLDAVTKALEEYEIHLKRDHGVSLTEEQRKRLYRIIEKKLEENDKR